MSGLDGLNPACVQAPEDHLRRSEQRGIGAGLAADAACQQTGENVRLRESTIEAIAELV